MRNNFGVSVFFVISALSLDLHSETITGPGGHIFNLTYGPRRNSGKWFADQDGFVWGMMVNDQDRDVDLSYNEAKGICNLISARNERGEQLYGRLPTNNEFMVLGKRLGRSYERFSSAAGYKPELFPGLKDNNFWTSSPSLSSASFAWIFLGQSGSLTSAVHANGYLSYRDTAKKAGALCVIGPMKYLDEQRVANFHFEGRWKVQECKLQGIAPVPPHLSLAERQIDFSLDFFDSSRGIPTIDIKDLNPIGYQLRARSYAKRNGLMHDSEAGAYFTEDVKINMQDTPLNVIRDVWYKRQPGESMDRKLPNSFQEEFSFSVHGNRAKSTFSKFDRTDRQTVNEEVCTYIRSK